MLEGSIAAAAAIGAWATGLAAVVGAQDRLIFGRPGRVRGAPDGPHQGHRTKPVEFEAAPGMWLRGWMCEPRLPARHLALWFAGRNENVAWVPPSLASWLGPDWAVIAFAYRGCGSSDGRPSETSSVEDARKILGWARAQTTVPAQRVLVIGRSLGSCVAMQLAASLGTELGGLALLAPPASVRRLVVRNPLLLPAVPWLRNNFDSVAAAADVRVPCLVLLAERDHRVPHSESLHLVASLRRTGARAAAHVDVAITPDTNHKTIARHPGTLSRLARFAAELAAAAAPGKGRSFVPQLSATPLTFANAKHHRT